MLFNCSSLIILLVPYTPELSELAKGDLFFFFFFFFGTPFIFESCGTSSFMLTDTEL